MGDEMTIEINDTYRDIGRLAEELAAWESPLCDKRVKRIILERLQEAQLWSLVLVKGHGLSSVEGKE